MYDLTKRRKIFLLVSLSPYLPISLSPYQPQPSYYNATPFYSKYAKCSVAIAFARFNNNHNIKNR
ncbi:MAG: hypothetical protein AAF383_07895 [Cyanobacteria bacterium P01_A01_bin.83]